MLSARFWQSRRSRAQFSSSYWKTTRTNDVSHWAACPVSYRTPFVLRCTRFLEPPVYVPGKKNKEWLSVVWVRAMVQSHQGAHLISACLWAAHQPLQAKRKIINRTARHKLCDFSWNHVQMVAVFITNPETCQHNEPTQQMPNNVKNRGSCKSLGRRGVQHSLRWGYHSHGACLLFLAMWADSVCSICHINIMHR